MPGNVPGRLFEELPLALVVQVAVTGTVAELRRMLLHWCGVAEVCWYHLEEFQADTRTGASVMSFATLESGSFWRRRC